MISKKPVNSFRRGGKVDEPSNDWIKIYDYDHVMGLGPEWKIIQDDVDTGWYGCCCSCDPVRKTCCMACCDKPL